MRALCQKVQVWIYYRHSRDQSLYFLLLLTLPKRGQFWQPVTGSVEQGESLQAAALREAQEESGLSFVNSPDATGISFEFDSRHGQRVIEFGFALQFRPQEELSGADEFPQVTVDPNEHMEYRWVEAHEVAKMVFHLSNIQVLDAVIRELSREN